MGESNKFQSQPRTLVEAPNDIRSPAAHATSDRTGFIGGSDARVIMGQDEKALITLWQEKRGERAGADLSWRIGLMTVWLFFPSLSQ